MQKCQVNSVPNVVAVHFGKKMTATTNAVNAAIGSRFRPTMEKEGKASDAQFANVLHFLMGNVGIVAHGVNNEREVHTTDDGKK